jgi:uncharacterized protein (DUF362 family)
VPAATAVINPALVIVATAVLLLTHVPNVVGLTVVVPPIHNEVLDPEIFVVGLKFTLTVLVGFDGHRVVLLVNVNVTEPPLTPVTTPAFVTVAMALLLLTHVPPVVGLKVVVEPAHIVLAPVMLTVGFALTVNGAVAKELQPVLVNVYVNVAVPAATAVINPALVIVATAVLLLTHEPNVVGLTVVVPPIHNDVLDPVIFVVGRALTVTVFEASDGQPVLVCVKVKVAVPPLTPVTTPPLVTLAIAVLLLDHVPPEVGLKVVVDPTHIVLAPVMLTVGFTFTVNGDVAKELHPVLVRVYVKVTVPDATAVINPALVIVATAVLLLTHVPNVIGLTVVVLPIHNDVLDPVILVVGRALTVTVLVASDGHNVVLLVNVNVAVPPLTPVTTPAFVTVATVALLLTHVPPVEGLSVVVEPSHIVLAPVILTLGFTFTVNGAVAKELHPLLVKVYVNVAVPAATAVINPALVIVATEVLLLTQVPKVVGLTVVVPPIHNEVLDPVILVVGRALTVTVLVASDGHSVVLLVNVNVAVPPLTPVTTPAFVTVAIAVLLLTHVPPVVGLKVVVDPSHIVLAPVILTLGFVLTVNGDVARELHPVLVNV